jgi:hypothetical protein
MIIKTNQAKRKGKQLKRGQNDMLLHSIVPFDMIFGSTDNQSTELKKVKGGYIELTNINGENHVSRIISTDPKMYLSKKYKLGEKL